MKARLWREANEVTWAAAADQGTTAASTGHAEDSRVRSVDADVAGEATRETEETGEATSEMGKTGEATGETEEVEEAGEAVEASPGGMVKMERGTTRATARMVPSPRRPLLLPQPQHPPLPQQPLLMMVRHLCKTTAVTTTPVTAGGGGRSDEKTSRFLFP